MITQATREALAGRAPPAGAKIEQSWITNAKSDLQDNFDPEFGGFRFSQQDPNIPKFPEPSNLLFLIDQLQQNPQDLEAERMLLTTCERMLMGGIYDHLGGGFHRYSVDRYWQIPHYEKMLYDNGQLASVYAAAYELTGREEFRVWPGRDFGVRASRVDAARTEGFTLHWTRKPRARKANSMSGILLK